MKKISELISILEVSTFRPNKEFFRGIGWEEDFRSYMREENKSRDVQLFYFEKLIEFLKEQCKSNTHSPIKMKFIIYFTIRGIANNKIWNKFNEAIKNSTLLEKHVDIIFGSNPLFLHLGYYIKGKRWFVRFYSKERCVLSPDLNYAFEADFCNSKIWYGAWNTFSSKTLEADLSRFHSPNFEIT